MEADPDSGRGENARQGRKFRIGMILYAVLAVAIWFTFGRDTVLVPGGRIEIRWIPLLIVVLFAFRAWIARKADKIRRRNRPEQDL